VIKGPRKKPAQLHTRNTCKTQMLEQRIGQNEKPIKESFFRKQLPP
jgi:hypothetical protein